MSVIEAIGRIETLNRNLARFWRTAHDWAPIEAAGLLSKSRPDWQVSLSRCLRLWIRTPPDRLEDGELILASANLGSLTEGTMKLFLSVFYHDYQKDIEGLKTARAPITRDRHRFLRAGLSLDVMRVYFKKGELLGTEIDIYVELVQQRRNAIHAYKDRPIGDDQKFSGGRSQLPYDAAGGKCTTTLSRQDLCSPGDLMSQFQRKSKRSLQVPSTGQVCVP